MSGPPPPPGRRTPSARPFVPPRRTTPSSVAGAATPGSLPPPPPACTPDALALLTESQAVLSRSVASARLLSESQLSDVMRDAAWAVSALGGGAGYDVGTQTVSQARSWPAAAGEASQRSGRASTHGSAASGVRSTAGWSVISQGGTQLLAAMAPTQPSPASAAVAAPARAAAPPASGSGSAVAAPQQMASALPPSAPPAISVVRSAAATAAPAKSVPPPLPLPRHAVGAQLPAVFMQPRRPRDAAVAVAAAAPSVQPAQTVGATAGEVAVSSSQVLATATAGAPAHPLATQGPAVEPSPGYVLTAFPAWQPPSTLDDNGALRPPTAIAAWDPTPLTGPGGTSLLAAAFPKVPALYPWQAEALATPGVMLDYSRPVVSLQPGDSGGVGLSCPADGFHHLLHRPRWLLYSAPTSGGKSLVADLLLMRRLLVEPGWAARRQAPPPPPPVEVDDSGVGGLPPRPTRPAAAGTDAADFTSRALIVLPYKTLCAEKEASLKAATAALAAAGGPKLQVRSFYGGKPGSLGIGKSRILIATIEMAHSIIDKLVGRGRLHELRTLVVDEVHLVGEEGRGATLEALLTKLICAQKASDAAHGLSGQACLCGGLSDGTALRLAPPPASSSSSLEPLPPPVDLQVVAMSATAPNLAELGRWLGAGVYVTTYRPVSLCEHIVTGGVATRVRPQHLPVRPGGPSLPEARHLLRLPPSAPGAPPPPPPTGLQAVTLLAAETVLQGAAALVFGPTRAQVVSIAKHLAAHLRPTAGALMAAVQAGRAPGPATLRTLDDPVLRTARAAIARRLLGAPRPPPPLPANVQAAAAATSSSASTTGRVVVLTGGGSRGGGASAASALTRDLAACVEAGVAFHHAGLTAVQREVIERGYRDGILPVLVASPTVAVGVNLPARRVIFRSPYLAGDMLTTPKYLQIAGRAGRAGFESVGEAYLVCDAARDVPVVTAMVLGALPAVKSQLLGKSSLAVPSAAPQPQASASAGETGQVLDLPALLDGAASGLLSFMLDAVDSKLVTTRQGLYAAVGQCTLLGEQLASQAGASGSSGSPASALAASFHACLSFLFRYQLLLLTAAAPPAPLLSAGPSSQVPAPPPGEVLALTPFGRATVHAHVSPAEAVVMYRDLLRLRGAVSLAVPLHLLSAIAPVNDEVRPAAWRTLFEDWWGPLPAPARQAALLAGVDPDFLASMQDWGDDDTPRVGASYPKRNCSSAGGGASSVASTSTPTSSGGPPSRSVATVTQELIVTHLRFYRALLVSEVLNGIPLVAVAARAKLDPGKLAALLAATATFGAKAVAFCIDLHWYGLATLLRDVTRSIVQQAASSSPRLRRFVATVDSPLLTPARARLLFRARIRDVRTLAATPVSRVTSLLTSALPFFMPPPLQTAEAAEAVALSPDAAFLAACAKAAAGRAKGEEAVAAKLVAAAQATCRRLNIPFEHLVEGCDGEGGAAAAGARSVSVQPSPAASLPGGAAAAASIGSGYGAPAVTPSIVGPGAISVASGVARASTATMAGGPPVATPAVGGPPPPCPPLLPPELGLVFASATGVASVATGTGRGAATGPSKAAQHRRKRKRVGVCDVTFGSQEEEAGGGGAGADEEDDDDVDLSLSPELEAEAAAQAGLFADLDGGSSGSEDADPFASDDSDDSNEDRAGLEARRFKRLASALGIEGHVLTDSDADSQASHGRGGGGSDEDDETEGGGGGLPVLDFGDGMLDAPLLGGAGALPLPGVGRRRLPPRLANGLLCDAEDEGGDDGSWAGGASQQHLPTTLGYYLLDDEEERANDVLGGAAVEEAWASSGSDGSSEGEEGEGEASSQSGGEEETGRRAPATKRRRLEPSAAPSVSSLLPPLPAHASALSLLPASAASGAASLPALPTPSASLSLPLPLPSPASQPAGPASFASAGLAAAALLDACSAGPTVAAAAGALRDALFTRRQASSSSNDEGEDVSLERITVPVPAAGPRDGNASFAGEVEGMGAGSAQPVATLTLAALRAPQQPPPLDTTVLMDDDGDTSSDDSNSTFNAANRLTLAPTLLVDDGGSPMDSSAAALSTLEAPTLPMDVEEEPLPAPPPAAEEEEQEEVSYFSAEPIAAALLGLLRSAAAAACAVPPRACSTLPPLPLVLHATAAPPPAHCMTTAFRWLGLGAWRRLAPPLPPKLTGSTQVRPGDEAPLPRDGWQELPPNAPLHPLLRSVTLSWCGPVTLADGAEGEWQLQALRVPLPLPLPLPPPYQQGRVADGASQEEDVLARLAAEGSQSGSRVDWSAALPSNVLGIIAGFAGFKGLQPSSSASSQPGSAMPAVCRSWRTAWIAAFNMTVACTVPARLALIEALVASPGLQLLASGTLPVQASITACQAVVAKTIMAPLLDAGLVYPLSKSVVCPGAVLSSLLSPPPAPAASPSPAAWALPALHPVVIEAASTALQATPQALTASERTCLSTTLAAAPQVLLDALLASEAPVRHRGTKRRRSGAVASAVAAPCSRAAAITAGMLLEAKVSLVVYAVLRAQAAASPAAAPSTWLTHALVTAPAATALAAASASLRPALCLDMRLLNKLVMLYGEREQVLVAAAEQLVRDPGTLERATAVAAGCASHRSACFGASGTPKPLVYLLSSCPEAAAEVLFSDMLPPQVLTGIEGVLAAAVQPDAPPLPPAAAALRACLSAVVEAGRQWHAKPPGSTAPLAPHVVEALADAAPSISALLAAPPPTAPLRLPPALAARVNAAARLAFVLHEARAVAALLQPAPRQAPPASTGGTTQTSLHSTGQLTHLLQLAAPLQSSLSVARGDIPLAALPWRSHSWKAAQPRAPRRYGSQPPLVFLAPAAAHPHLQPTSLFRWFPPPGAISRVGRFDLQQEIDRGGSVLVEVPRTAMGGFEGAEGGGGGGGLGGAGGATYLVPMDLDTCITSRRRDVTECAVVMARASRLDTSTSSGGGGEGDDNATPMLRMQTGRIVKIHYGATMDMPPVAGEAPAAAAEREGGASASSSSPPKPELSSLTAYWSSHGFKVRNPAAVRQVSVQIARGRVFTYPACFVYRLRAPMFCPLPPPPAASEQPQGPGGAASMLPQASPLPWELPVPVNLADALLPMPGHAFLFVPLPPAPALAVKVAGWLSGRLCAGQAPAVHAAFVALFENCLLEESAVSDEQVQRWVAARDVLAAAALSAVAWVEASLTRRTSLLSQTPLPSHSTAAPQLPQSPSNQWFAAVVHSRRLVAAAAREGGELLLAAVATVVAAPPFAGRVVVVSVGDSSSGSEGTAGAVLAVPHALMAPARRALTAALAAVSPPGLDLAPPSLQLPSAGTWGGLLAGVSRTSLL